MEKNFVVLNNILFYIIIGLIIFTSMVVLFVTRKSSLYVFYESLNIIRSKKRETKRTISIPIEYLSYYLSVIWWMIFYLLVVTIFVVIAKTRHDPNLIYDLF